MTQSFFFSPKTAVPSSPLIAPVALACHALPQTDPAARLWWRSFLGCAAVPTLQAVTLTAGHWMLLDPAHLLPVFGLPVEPGEVINLLIVIRKSFGLEHIVTLDHMEKLSKLVLLTSTQ